MSINRRAFLGWAGVGAAASSLGMAFANRLTQPPRIASADSPISDLEEQTFRGSLNSYKFPKDFFWGVATSAFQIEGAVNEGGRKPSVWDTFSAIPGRIKDGSSPAVACDHYHRYKDDIKLMAQLGVKDYRFSIAWPRIIPDGRGKVNEEGVDFYKRLLDELNKYGITPHATLFHWDSPQALEDKYGSWRSREMASDFADYATAIVTRLGDRITHWMTLNEISQFTHLAYGVDSQPNNAPGTRVSSKKEVWQTSHHALLAHGLGCQAIRAASPKPCAIALVLDIGSTVPLTESAADIAAAQKAFHTYWFNGGIIFPALTGAYSPIMLKELGADAPDIQDGDLKTIHQPLDDFGINLYTGKYARAANNPQGYELLDFPKSYPKMQATWIKFIPESLYWAIRHVSDTLGRQDLPLFVSENGCITQDELNESGEVIDSDRILYLRQYLRAAHRAIQEKYPLKGYFLWSLMDNFEWSRGYSDRFGIVYTDYKTQKRIPKASFNWYAECIRQNRVV
ncbi:GH1 family beta-glucosidase [Allocoleopsis franciscana]|uniref:Beta-glucosidase n=1 Tax=Allocoleopsis franciscana PCC 7113 TaxID=1173027 RepID=K9WM42_9CYAN|nr:GH1 family beta-glucosidase [Allocoleopsis franciscana]AFZ20849.1 beta-galactosidase [Allocoleopsis franciscana PCC 7113]